MMDFSAIVQSVAQKYNVDPALINAVISKESSGDATAWNKGGGGQGAAGAMQVRAPALADYNAANGTKYGMSDLLKPQVGIDVGSWYLGQQLDKFNDPSKALVAYNEGAASPTVQKGTSTYAQQVLGKLNMPQKAQTLPGIPTVSASAPQVQDAFGSLAVDGQQPPSAQAPQASSDPFSSLPVASDSKAATPKAAQPVASTPGGIESFAAGLGKGFGSTVLGAQQLLGKIFEGPSQSTARAIGLDSLGDLYQRAGGWLVNDANQGLQNLGSQTAPYQQAHPIATMGGDIGGAIGATLPLGLGAAAADTLLGAGLRGIATGAAGSAASPVDPNSQNFWGDKAQQIAVGGGLGGLLGAGSRVVGNMISPNVSPDVQALMSRGVTPTPGQILGGGFARIEAKLTSVPVLGDMIKNAQGRALGQFNEAAYNEALAPIGQKFTGKVGQEGIEQVGKQIGDVYDSVLPQMQLKVDPQFQSDVINLGQMAQSLPDAQQKQFMNLLQTQIFGKLGPQGNMDGQTLKGVQSELAKTAKGYLGDASYDNRQLGTAVSALRDAVDSNLARVNPPDLSQQLANANAAWANFVRLRSAAASTGAMNNDGVFTAAQLQSAVRNADKSVGKGATATGNALMQDLSSAGHSVLGSKYPDSGTVGRGLLSLLAPGSVAAGLATAPASTLATLGGIGLGSIPYTSLGQRGIASLLTARPQFAQPVAKAVGALTPVVIPGGLSALLSGSR